MSHCSLLKESKRNVLKKVSVGNLFFSILLSIFFCRAEVISPGIGTLNLVEEKIRFLLFFEKSPKKEKLLQIKIDEELKYEYSIL